MTLPNLYVLDITLSVDSFDGPLIFLPPCSPPSPSEVYVTFRLRILSSTPFLSPNTPFSVSDTTDRLFQSRSGGLSRPYF